MNLFQGNIFLFPFFLLLFYSPINWGGGGMAPLCILAIPVTVVQPRFVNGGKARELSDRARGGCGRGVSHGREIFQNLCMKLAFSCTLDTIIRGSLCTGIDQFPTLFLFSFFSYNEFVSGKHFPFSLSFSLFSPSKSWVGGGATAPIAPWLRHCL